LGDKKQMSRQLAKQYNPTAVEKSWVLIQSLWLLVVTTLRLNEMLIFYCAMV
jgi:hypothetical protein